MAGAQAGAAAEADAERIRRQRELVDELSRSPATCGGDLEPVARLVTEACARLLEAERVGVWLFDPAETELRCVDQFNLSTGRHTSGAVLHEHEFRAELTALKRALYVDAHDPYTDPRTAGYVDGYLRPNRISSMLDLVIRFGGRNLGTLCFEHVDRAHTWRQDEVDFGCLVGGQLSILLERRALRRTMGELRESEARFQALFEQAGDAVYVVDGATFGILEANEQARRSTGYDRAELLRLTVPDLDPEWPLERLHALVASQAGSPGPVTVEGVHRRRDGTTFPVECRATRVEEKEGPRVLCIVRDTSDRRRAEEERRRTQAQLLHVQKLESLGVLAGGIAHDFNNLLVGVLGNASLARLKLPASSPLREVMDDIEAGAERAADLTRQLLAYAGKGRFIVEPIDLDLLVEEMARLLRTVISKKATLRLTPGAGGRAVEADATQMRQVLMNLITNASEALQDAEGVIGLTTGVVEADAHYLAECEGAALPPGPYVTLEVSDTGCGMDAHTRARVFDPFFSTKQAGRGLGLSATIGIVRAHRGAIKVYSEPGKGSTFKVLLPASGSPAAPPRAAQVPAQAPRGVGTALVIEDDEAVLKVARLVLEAACGRVLLARDGAQGVELFRAHAAEVSVVLLDLTLPRLDGAEVFRALRALRPDVSVVLMSGHNQNEVTTQFAGKGLAGFLQKPFRAEDLLQKVREAIARRQL